MIFAFRVSGGSIDSFELATFGMILMSWSRGTAEISGGGGWFLLGGEIGINITCRPAAKRSQLMFPLGQGGGPIYGRDLAFGLLGPGFYKVTFTVYLPRFP